MVYRLPPFTVVVVLEGVQTQGNRVLIVFLEMC